MKNTLIFISFIVSLSFAQAQGKIIKIDGSSTVYPITEAVAEEFQIAEKGKTKVTVGISGTGGGFKKFCRGETDIQNASRPISTEEMKACRDTKIEYIELPIAFDAITVVVNPKNKMTSIKSEELKKIWAPDSQGKIMNWSDVNPSWPKEKLKLYGAGSDSGTFDYFTEAIVGKAKSSRGDYTGSEDDNTLVQGVSNDKNALGYIPFSYYIENKNKLKVLAIDQGKGPVLPSKESVENASYQPLSRPIFIYVNKNSLSKAEVKTFAQFFLKNAALLVPQVKYVALPEKAYTMGLEHLSKQKVGTVFGGHSAVGISIDEMLKREFTH